MYSSYKKCSWCKKSIESIKSSSFGANLCSIECFNKKQDAFKKINTERAKQWTKAKKTFKDFD